MTSSSAASSSSSSQESLQQQIQQAEQELLLLEKNHHQSSSTTTTTRNPKLIVAQIEQLDVWHSVTRLARQQQQQQQQPNCIDAFEQLEAIFLKHPPSLVQHIAQQEYFPWHDYYQSHFTRKLQHLLQKYQYPHALLEVGQEQTLLQIQDACQSLERLAVSRMHLERHLGITTDTRNTEDTVTRELMRPWVQRIQFHFLHQPSMRIDKLPECLFKYVQQHILTTWDIVQAVAPHPKRFLHELVRLIQYVFMERNVFRQDHPPHILMNAIQQLFLFDSDMQQHYDDANVIRLVDVFVVGDDELWEWWLQNEQAVVLRRRSTLEDTDDNLAEVLCAQLRSCLTKASLVSLQGAYLTRVVAPLCTRFLELWQNAADALAPTEYKAWKEWIQGTHSVIEFLQTQQEDSDDINHMGRFATSLQALEDAVVDEFAKNLVERVLMMDAKLAAYLMRASFQVQHQQEQQEEEAFELTEVRHVLTQFHQETNDDSYAAQRMRDCVLSLLAEPFLHVALNTDGMTPELVERGSLGFAHNVQSVFDVCSSSSTTELPLEAQRLLDVTRWMSLEYTELNVMGHALCGLAGIPLTMESFHHDDRLAAEAMDMIRAKGFLCMELEDAISIINRRIDVGPH